MDVEHFLGQALRSTTSWKRDDLDASSRLSPADGLWGPRRKDLLRGDIHSQWSIWFIESLADPRRYVKSDKTYAHVLADVTAGVRRQYSGATKSEIDHLARTVAKTLWDRISLLRDLSSRHGYGREQRLELLAAAGTPPRCWICGHAFGDQARDKFLGESAQVRPYRFLDVLKPAGLGDSDLDIQIEHISPWSHGGRDNENLALACRWCNRHKSNHRSIYDVEGAPLNAGSNSWGLGSLPQKFWVVRLLALQKACEHPGGCSNSTQNAEMTVEPINPQGALVPSNLRVICSDHHWLGHDRLQPRELVRRLWGLS